MPNPFSSAMLGQVPDIDATLPINRLRSYVPADPVENLGRFNYPYYAGIELEIEGNPSQEGFPRTFEWTSDGSLRNGGVEARLRQPLAGQQLERSLDRLDNWLSGCGYSLSERCSTHIHLDVRDMSPNQIFNLLCLSIMLEHVMFRLFGAERTANTFCLATDTGTSNLEDLIDSMHKPYYLLNKRWSKYAAIGLYRLQDLGTVEYRMFTAMTSKQQYYQLLDFLFALKTQAMEMESPSQLVDFKLSMNAQELFTRYFPEDAYSPEFDSLLERGVQTLNDVLVPVSVLKIVEERSRKYEVLRTVAQEQIQELQRGV